MGPHLTRPNVSSLRNSYIHVLESNWLREMQCLVNRKKKHEEV